MELNKQYHLNYQNGQETKTERQAKGRKNKNEELQISFHNPNSELDTAKFIARLILDSLDKPE
ncbi:hypothetical protein [Anaerocolumna sp. MB42-C2]|uniref:hypothetical protein n=1 Tax=Anaerocolumna sp. MB42-C2 TaxID=3070997 RepID=UPI0027E13A07|nr:hypothetical protein [Anaerocolumna sp. MB42-C2]WMJ85717.1 hypothetical protein RBU59_16790 [Anaerocolumna sp. MB42-C2]